LAGQATATVWRFVAISLNGLLSALEEVKAIGMKHVAVLLAGGSSSRMGHSVDDKILTEIAGRSVFAHVIEAFHQSGIADGLVVVAHDDRQRRKLDAIYRESKSNLPLLLTLGGRERQDSVRAGLDLLPSEAEWIYIHDCARPAISPASLQALRKALLESRGAVAMAHRVADTIRRFDEDPTRAALRGSIVPRETLWAMETPQAFPRSLIEEAHDSLNVAVTDDLAAVEALGHPVRLVESLDPNPKLTRPADLFILESILQRRLDMNNQLRSPVRVGCGYDIHRLQEGIPLILGGVPIRSDVGLVGHSDADVLTHAIADAILGGAGLPDIGHYFPNTDPEIEGISSQEILKKAVAEADSAGYQLVNIDSTLIAEKPKISPYLDRMKAQLARSTGLAPDAIGIKATTQEKIGALGQGSGIAAHAVVCLST